MLHHCLKLCMLMQGGDLYSALRNHPETMKWERLGRKVALDVALGINYLHTRYSPALATSSSCLLFPG